MLDGISVSEVCPVQTWTSSVSEGFDVVTSDPEPESRGARYRGVAFDFRISVFALRRSPRVDQVRTRTTRRSTRRSTRKGGLPREKTHGMPSVLAYFAPVVVL